MPPGDLDNADLECFLIKPEMDLAQDSRVRVAMFAGVPFVFALDLDCGAIVHHVQWPLRIFDLSRSEI